MTTHFTVSCEAIWPHGLKAWFKASESRWNVASIPITSWIIESDLKHMPIFRHDNQKTYLLILQYCTWDTCASAAPPARGPRRGGPGRGRTCCSNTAAGRGVTSCRFSGAAPPACSGSPDKPADRRSTGPKLVPSRTASVENSSAYEIFIT